MKACPRCSAPLETPLACSACGALLPAGSGGDLDPFEVFGFAVSGSVDAGELERRLLRFSRLVHPDFFATQGPEARARAESASAQLNAAHDVLAGDTARADWIVKHLGGPDEQAERSMPQEFLLEVLEWNELVEAARSAPPGAPERAAVGRLRGELEQRLRGLQQDIVGRLEPLPEKASPVLALVRKQLNAVRYLEKTLAEIDALRVAQSMSR